MRVDPAIAALRRDRAPQREAQAAMVAACDAWRGAPEAVQALSEFDSYGVGAPLAACPALHALFTDRVSARPFVSALVGAFCRTLIVEPFGHPPLRHGYDRGVSTLLLARHGRAQLVLHACEPGRRSYDSASFPDAERHEAVLAGAAEARIVRRTGVSRSLEQRSLALRQGVCLALDLTGSALQILHVERRLVSLRLHRIARHPRPTCEHALEGGALLCQSSGDMRASRFEAMLALLGRMGRIDAAPTMAALAREPGDASLRWQALRECLALDTAAGFAALSDIHRAADDPLAVSAASLRAHLLDAHPELAALAIAVCRA